MNYQAPLRFFQVIYRVEKYQIHVQDLTKELFEDKSQHASVSAYYFFSQVKDEIQYYITLL